MSRVQLCPAVDFPRGPVRSAIAYFYPGCHPAEAARTLAHELRAAMLSSPTRCAADANRLDPFGVAEYLGLPVERADIQAQGVLAGWPDNGVRIVLPLVPPHGNRADERRERFTVAHEIGHFMLRNLARQHSSNATTEPDPDEEWLCNNFAGELLAPRRVVLQHFSVHGATPATVLQLADKLGVSITAILTTAALSNSRRRAPSFTAVLWRRQSKIGRAHV